MRLFTADNDVNHLLDSGKVNTVHTIEHNYKRVVVMGCHVNRHVSWPRFRSWDMKGMTGSVYGKYAVESMRTMGRWTTRTFTGRVIKNVQDDKGYNMFIVWNNGDEGVIRLTRGKYNTINFVDVSGRPEWVISKNCVRIKLSKSTPEVSDSLPKVNMGDNHDTRAQKAVVFLKRAKREMEPEHFMSLLNIIIDFQAKNQRGVSTRQKVRMLKKVYRKTRRLLINRLYLVDLFRAFTTYLPSKITCTYT